MPRVEQELLTLPLHMSSLPVFSGVRVVRCLVFYVVCFRSLCVLFLLAIVLSDLIRLTVSNYTIGIFKLFFTNGIFCIELSRWDILCI